MTTNTNRQQLSWAFYDWANSAFATTVMAGFFPLFFKKYWASDLAAETSTFYLGLANSSASFIIMILAPILGSLADSSGTHKRLLICFAMLGVLATTSFFFISQGMWPIACIVYVVSIIGFSGANVFYDALLPILAPKSKHHSLSALGFALGYLGGGVLFAINVAMTLKPSIFGLADSSEAVRWSFMSVGIWWMIFTLPLLFTVKDQPESANKNITIRSSLQNLLVTFRRVFSNRNIALFVVAYWFYIDGLATIIKMAVDYGMSIGLPSSFLVGWGEDEVQNLDSGLPLVPML